MTGRRRTDDVDLPAPEPAPTIRVASPDDAGAIAACLAAAFEPYRAAYTLGAFADTVLSTEGVVHRLDRMTLLVAQDVGGAVVGTVALAVGGDGEGHLRGMAVRPEHQGGGAASRLLAEAERRLREADCTRVTLDTTEPLARAIRFYERQGYTTTGEVLDFFGMPLYGYAKALGG